MSVPSTHQRGNRRWDQLQAARALWFRRLLKNGFCPPTRKSAVHPFRRHPSGRGLLRSIRITDPITYVRNTSDLLSVQQVEQASKDSLSEALRSVGLSTVLSDQRDQLLLNVRSEISTKMGELGIDVVDIRIGRADFVAENLPFAFNEMSADLLDTYKSELSNGSAEGERLRATANQEARTKVATARATAAIMRGEAEAEAARLLNAAHGRDLKFYTFWQSMQAYRESVALEDNALILSTENDFLKCCKAEPASVGSALTGGLFQAQRA